MEIKYITKTEEYMSKYFYIIELHTEWSKYFTSGQMCEMLPPKIEISNKLKFVYLKIL